jgi:hypothetical protein
MVCESSWALFESGIDSGNFGQEGQGIQRVRGRFEEEVQWQCCLGGDERSFRGNARWGRWGRWGLLIRREIGRPFRAQRQKGSRGRQRRNRRESYSPKGSCRGCPPHTLEGGEFFGIGGSQARERLVELRVVRITLGHEIPFSINRERRRAFPRS